MAEPDANKNPFRRLRQAHLRLGRRGEAVACRLLKQRGMEIITRNYVGPHGEIDIVARDGATLCFVEVKTRHRPVNSRPADAVTPRKKHNLIHTGNRYLRLLGSPELRHRFDIVEVIYEGRRLLELRHWPNEFTREDIRYFMDDKVYILDDSGEIR